jgi:hypothetical protein
MKLVAAVSRPQPGIPPSPNHTLDSLAKCDSAELEELFAAGGSSPLDALSGHPAGRMLAVPWLEAVPVAAPLRRVAKSSLFVWEGKSFVAPTGASTGQGINRVRLFGRRTAFPFRTFEATSLVDGRPCLAIAYDLPEMPAFARGTYDELRLVGKGLYLGRGMRKRSDRGLQLLVWFALDTNRCSGTHSR